MNRFGSRLALQSLIWLSASLSVREEHTAHYPNQWSFKLQSLPFQIPPKTSQHIPKAESRAVPVVLSGLSNAVSVSALHLNMDYGMYSCWGGWVSRSGDLLCNEYPMQSVVPWREGQKRDNEGGIAC